MTRKRVISLFISVGLTASCSTVVADKSVKAEPNLIMDVVILDKKEIALQAMNEMSIYLRSLKKFAVNTEVLPNRQKVLLDKSVDTRAKMSSRMWAKAANIYTSREFYFAGQSFSLYNSNLGHFATAEIPITDMSIWGVKADSSVNVDETIFVGIDLVENESCNPFAFRQKEIDRQICIQQEGGPLPFKFVTTEKSIEIQQQHISVFNQNTVPELGKQKDTFTAHDSDQKIKFGKIVIDKQG